MDKFERVRAFIIELGKQGKRQQLADAVGYTYQNIVKIEKGQNFSAEGFSNFCRYFGLDENTGLSFVESSLPPPPGHRRIRRPRRPSSTTIHHIQNDADEQATAEPAQAEYVTEDVTDEEWSLIEMARQFAKHPNRERHNLQLKVSASNLTHGEKDAVLKTIEKEYLAAAQTLLRLVDTKIPK